MSTLLDYLNVLDKDAVAREAHKKDPKAAMRKFGLTAVEKDVFLSGDKTKLADLLGISAESLPAIKVLPY